MGVRWKVGYHAGAWQVGWSCLEVRLVGTKEEGLVEEVVCADGGGDDDDGVDVDVVDGALSL